MKQTGILMSVSSLSAPYGVGELGNEAFEWIDTLHKNNIDIWQILPLNPTGYGNSPYQPYSSFAGDEIYISLKTLADEGLIDNLPKPFENQKTRIDYDKIRAWKAPFLRKAFEKFTKTDDYNKFAQNEWVIKYAVFRAMKKANNNCCWTEWEINQRDWNGNTIPQEFKKEAEYHIFLQYKFLQQWQNVKNYANKKNIHIMGDVPFYVGIDSVDVWANRSNFLLDKDGNPRFIAGVPPDYFSETGQRWGNPIYDWDELEKTGFKFWVDRIGYSQKLFDIIRIDHFRAFDTFWKIPVSCPTAVEGEWIEVSGYKVIDTLYKEIPNLCLVAEDLGDLRPEVLTLRDHYNLKGMKILEFDIDTNGKYAKIIGESKENQILYTGTHDNATLLEWYKSLKIPERRKVRKMLKKYGFKDKNITSRLNALALSAISDWVILPMQDVIGLGAEARMNLPGTVGSPNWEWYLPDMKLAKKSLNSLKSDILKWRN